jgi:beta-glucosidase
MSINSALLEGVLKQGMIAGEKPFNGFLISDYDEVGKIAGQGWPTTNIKMELDDAVADIINAGVDMMMLAITNPGVTIDYYQETMVKLVKEGVVSEERVNESVKRILGVKLAMNLVTESKQSLKKPAE